MESDLMRAVRDVVPPEVTDCASWWNYMGTHLPENGRNVMLNTQVSVVTVDGERATATYTTGGTVPLRWTDGRWRLD
jgi:hypothetical protein